MKLTTDNYLDEVLLKLEQLGASDIHIKSGYKIYYRFCGDIKIFEESVVLDNKKILEFISPILNSKIQDDFKQNKQADFAISSSNNTRYRVNLFKTSTGYSISLRRINNKTISIEKLMLGDVFNKIVKLKKGLVLITGATGSGKSTTLSAIIDYINTNQQKHIITLEDPIEFIHYNKKSLINQREVGVDVPTFGLGLKSILREDPDVILVGEMRDSESIKECLRASETGHLVFSTLHTSSASKSIDRIVDSCAEGDKNLVRTMLATSLQAIISQKLVKGIDGKSMLMAHEIMICTSAIRNLIRENKISQIDSMLQTGKQFGMITMENHITELFEKGFISKEEYEDNINNLGKNNG